jgi:hypothetical protein
VTDKKTALDRTSYGAVFTGLHDGNSISPKGVDASIRYVASTGAKLDGTIHGTAVACIHLSMPHKDNGHNCANRAAALVNAMPKSSRRKALIAWFTAFSNIRFVADPSNKAVLKGHVLPPSSKMYADARPDDAYVKPFWTVEEKGTDASEFNALSLAKAVAALIKRASNENAKLDSSALDVLADLKGLSARLPSLEKVAA